MDIRESGFPTRPNSRFSKSPRPEGLSTSKLCRASERLSFQWMIRIFGISYDSKRVWRMVGYGATVSNGWTLDDGEYLESVDSEGYHGNIANSRGT